MQFAIPSRIRECASGSTWARRIASISLRAGLIILWAAVAGTALADPPTWKPVGPHPTTKGQVERTFAWLGRCRRLSKDREKSVLSSESLIKLAMTQLMLHRLRPSKVDPEFHYSSAA